MRFDGHGSRVGENRGAQKSVDQYSRPITHGALNTQLERQSEFSFSRLITGQQFLAGLAKR